MDRITGYIGTYLSPESLGVYRFTVNPENGQLTEPELFLEAPDAKYVSVKHGWMAAPVMRDGAAGVCLAQTSEGKVKRELEICNEQKTPCFVVQDGDFLFTANYHEGNVMVYGTEGGELSLIKRIEIAPKAGCHQVLLHSHYILVPSLALDSIRIFDRDRDFAPAGSIQFPKGSGPRHGIFTADHRRLFVVSELSNEVYSFAVKGETGFELEQTVRILPDGAVYETEPSTAAVRLSPDERRLYVSTRGAELLTVYGLEDGRLTHLQQTGSKGKHPRDFTLTPDGRYLLVVNRYEGGLVSLALNESDGTIGEICSRVPAPEGVSVVLDV